MIESEQDPPEVHHSTLRSSIKVWTVVVNPVRKTKSIRFTFDWIGSLSIPGGVLLGLVILF